MQSNYPQSRVRMAYCTVAHGHDVAVACRVALAAAEHLGFGRRDQYSISTSVSELATNLVLHADGGVIHVNRVFDQGGGLGLELIASDSGPGIPDVDRALQDGFSTAGGLGGGLGAVRRLMGEIVVASAAGQGTIVRAVKWRAEDCAQGHVERGRRNQAEAAVALTSRG